MPATDRPVMGLPERDLGQIVQWGGSAWAGLRGAQLFVTGGTGFFGQWLLASLCLANRELGLGARACVLTRDPARFRARAPGLAADPAITLWPGDVRDFAYPAGRFSHIIHAATDTTQAAGQEPFKLIDTIVGGTRRVLDFARTCGAGRLLYLSSGAVYGGAAGAQDGIREDAPGACDPLDPASSYGQGKRLAEHLCALATAREGIDCVIARCFACVGPLLPLDTHFAIGNFIRDALWRDGIRVRGNGMPLRSYLYVADLAAWLWRLLVEGRGGRAYNVGSGDAVSIADLARLVADTLAPGKPVLIEAAAAATGNRDRYVPCIGRASQELGLAAWTPLDEAIRRTAHFALGAADRNSASS